MSAAQIGAPLIIAKGLVKQFGTGLLRSRGVTRALDCVDATIFRGEVCALIGESGSGKTTLGKVLLRLTRLDAGQVLFEGEDVFRLCRRALKERRRSFQMVFQNQAANLHPKMTVIQMMLESLKLHRSDLSHMERASLASDLLKKVGLVGREDQRPASLSGGERRRVGLARILATKPLLIVADEPTSGLDAAIKLQVIQLLKQLKEPELTYLLISHDLGLVRRIADRVLVMLRGRIIEECPVGALGGEIHHPYTEKLMRAADLLGDVGRLDEAKLPRDSEPIGQSDGCPHRNDCQLARRLGILARCRAERPTPVELGHGHWIACFGAETLREELRR